MDPKRAYKIWSEHYDINENKTRDLEAKALRTELSEIKFDNCLEIGCGTGKNTLWLLKKSEKVTAVDISHEMLNKAKEKIISENVSFIKADINKEWKFVKRKFDLVCFSLVLEHIKDLDHIFQQASKSLIKNGYVYIGELHPYKQYTGTKAVFETKEGKKTVTCFDHNISEFTQSAKKYGMIISEINEYFDPPGSGKQGIPSVPRILTILFQKI